jgi:hypothetical protein
VEDARHVGRGDHHGIGFPTVGLAVEMAGRYPVLVPPVFGLAEIEGLAEFHEKGKYEGSAKVIIPPPFRPAPGTGLKARPDDSAIAN